MIGNIDREKIRIALKIPDPFGIALVIALGKPKEKVIIDSIGEDKSIRYWRDPDGRIMCPNGRWMK